MLGTVPSLKKNLGAPLGSRKAMLETLFRHLDMVRLSVGAMAMLTLASCTGLIDGAGDGLTSQERTARRKWTELALPVLSATCQNCHGGSRPMIDFMKGDDPLSIRDNIKAYQPPVVNTDAPSSARLVSKGIHDGPALTVEQRSALIDWMQSERDSETHMPGPTTKVLATAPFAVLPCTAGLPDNNLGTCPTNHVSLADVGDVGATIPGAEISFNAQPLSSGLYLTNLKFAGGTAGAYAEHPLFVSVPAMGDPLPDQLDRYFALKLNTKPGAADPLGGGTDQFVGFQATDKLEIHFKVVGAYKPDAGGGTTGPTGCRVLASFTSNAAPQLQANCSSCHGGANGGATAAMNTTDVLSTDPAKALAACNEVRTRVNLTTTNSSSIYLAPDPDPNNKTAHQFKFQTAGQFTTFKTSVDIWVQAEKTAP